MAKPTQAVKILRTSYYPLILLHERSHSPVSHSITSHRQVRTCTLWLFQSVIEAGSQGDTHNHLRASVGAAQGLFGQRKTRAHA
ncbi:hypothetical protein VTK26DRAFT_8722 [Humicola hyalothermophila]